MFCGIFGHKPTGGFLSVSGHFPTSVDENFSTYLVVGPMCRHAKDLPTLLHVFSGGKTEKLRLHEPLYTKDIKVFCYCSTSLSFYATVNNIVRISDLL